MRPLLYSRKKMRVNDLCFIVYLISAALVLIFVLRFFKKKKRNSTKERTGKKCPLFDALTCIFFIRKSEELKQNFLFLCLCFFFFRNIQVEWIDGYFWLLFFTQHYHFFISDIYFFTQHYHFHNKNFISDINYTCFEFQLFKFD